MHEGRRTRLETWKFQSGRKHWEIALDLGLSKSGWNRVCGWLRGKSDVPEAHRGRFAQLCGIPEKELFDSQGRARIEGEGGDEKARRETAGRDEKGA